MPLPESPNREALRFLSPGVFVDREKSILRGYVVAEAGPFKSRRGEFTQDSLRRIVNLMNQAEPTGLKSRFTHPGMSDDGLGSFLGRARNARLDGKKVRADLHLDPTAFTSPKGNLGQYVMDLATSDPGALSSSLVLRSEKIRVLGDNGKPKTDDKGEEVPPVWLPTQLLASDIVDTGDAVGNLLSHDVDPDGLPLGFLWRGCEALDHLFAGATRETVQARLSAFSERYIAMRFGEAPQVPANDGSLSRRLRIAELQSIALEEVARRTPERPGVTA